MPQRRFAGQLYGQSPGITGWLPVGWRRQRAYRQACPKRANRVFRQLVDREISPAKFEWRIATDNNRNDRQVRLVVGRFGQCSKCSRQVIGASGDQRDHQRVGFA